MNPEQQEDPYKILGVPPDASPELIKSVFSKAALRTHQKCNNTVDGSSSSSSQDECREAARQFSRISNAYQILSDPKQKRRYDDSYNRFSRRSSDDPFSSRHRKYDIDDERIVDPFEQFFGGVPGGVFGGDNMFQDVFEEMRRMQEQQQQQQPGNDGGRNNNNNGFFSASSSSRSSTTYQGKNGERITEVTTTRRVNGKEETVKERVIHKADGTVERQIESNDESSSLPTITSMQQSSSPMVPRRRRPTDNERVVASNQRQHQQQQQQNWSRRFGMTPEQRAQLNDDDDDDDANDIQPSTFNEQSTGNREPKKKSWSFW